MLVSRLFVRILHGMLWNVGCRWGRRIINVLCQDLVGGGGMGRPLDRALYGDDVLA